MGVAPLHPERLTSIAVARIHGAKAAALRRADLMRASWDGRIAGLCQTSPTATIRNRPPEYRAVHAGPIRTALTLWRRGPSLVQDQAGSRTTGLLRSEP